MKQFLIILIVVGALAFGGFHFYGKWQEKNRATAAANQPKTVQVESRDIRFNVTAAGDIGPADQVSVRPEVNGKISELPVDIGDHVKRGDLLCRLDDQDLQIERSSRLTEIEGARLQLEKAKRNFERSKKLFAESLIAREVFDDAKTEFDLAENSLERADKALRLVEDRISKTKIIAPFDCTILTRPVSIGQAVSGSGGFNSGTEIMTVANLKDMIITAHISQADVTRLHSDQEVDVEVESVSGLKMKGAVERIAPQATLKNNLKGFSARIVIKNIDARVRPGMTANLSIPLESAEGVLAVPLAAVFTEDDQRVVYVKSGDSFERRPVKLGVSDYFFAEITTGLASGDVVALQLPAKISEGEKKPGKGSSPKSGTNQTAGASTTRRSTL